MSGQRVDVELAEVRDFLAAQAPFDALPAVELDRLPRECSVRYARRGTTVLAAGAPAEGLLVVRSGAVDITDEAGGLVERAGPGDTLGTTTLLEGRPTRHTCTAAEDTLLLVLPPETATGLVETHPAVAAWLAGTHHDRMARGLANLQQASTGAAVLGRPVSDLVDRAPVTADPGVSVREAATTMSQAGVSSLLLVEDGRLVGILTDRDLRARVLAAGLDPATPVREVMTTDPVTLPAGGQAFEALLEMVGRTIHHLPLVDDRGRPTGLVSTTDLIRLEESNPVYLAADVARAPDLAAVVSQAGRIPSVLGQLLDADATAEDIGRVVTALGDAVRRRVLALVERDLAATAGPAPTAWAWVVLGSVARGEEGLSADQDHALVVGEEGHDGWFGELAERVTAALEECGWPRCPGEVMATNPAWRGSIAAWQERVVSWSRDPASEAVLHAATAFDLRHLAGDPALAARVRDTMTASPRLVGHLSAQALGMRPPLGVFGSLVVDHRGEQRDTLDVKRPIAAVVQMARVYALRVGSTAVSTRERIAAAGEAGLLGSVEAGDLRDALELMSYLRLRHQVAQVRAGRRPDNRLAPTALTERERRHLKDAFGIVRRAQQQLGAALGPGYT